MTEGGQVVDPAVSRAKFDLEVADFRAMAAVYAARGWFLLEAEFPEILVLLAAPQIKPSPIVTGVLLDYTDYDLKGPLPRAKRARTPSSRRSTD